MLMALHRSGGAPGWGVHSDGRCAFSSCWVWLSEPTGRSSHSVAFAFWSFFPLGIILVFFLGAELFTGNNATLIPATLRGEISRGYFLKNWGVVYFGNFVGALFFVYFFVHLPGLLSVSPWREAIVGVAEKKVSLPFSEAFLRGIGANWFVCLAFWLGLSSVSAPGRMLGLWMPVMAFVTMGFSHSIANKFLIPRECSRART